MEREVRCKRRGMVIGQGRPIVTSSFAEIPPLDLTIRGFSVPTTQSRHTKLFNFTQHHRPLEHLNPAMARTNTKLIAMLFALIVLYLAGFGLAKLESTSTVIDPNDPVSETSLAYPQPILIKRSALRLHLRR